MTSLNECDRAGAGPIHGFRSATAVVAYCGAVERPTEPRHVCNQGQPPADACPECVTAWQSMQH